MTWDDEPRYTARVLTAYKALAEEMQSPDVTIAVLHRRVGGSIQELHDWLRSECQAQRCVPSVGEPVFAGDAAKQSVLRLPGERESFLRVKLLEPPMIQEQRQAKPDHERYEELLRATAELRYPPEERTPELEAWIEKTIARKVQEFREERRAKAYEATLRKELAARHPTLTPEQKAHYERRIADLVAEFRQNQAQRQQQTPARSREQGRGISMEM